MIANWQRKPGRAGEIYRPEKKPWPLWAKPFALQAKDVDKGLGDIIHRMLGGDAFPKWFETEFGRTCGCTDRVKWINERFPL